MTRRRLVIGSWVAAGLGAIGLAIGFAVEPTQAAFSYLTAWVFAMSVALGALIFLMIGHAVSSRWVLVFRTLTEAIVSTLPALAVLFLPIVFAIEWLYPWVHPSPALGHEALVKLAHKAPYLDVSFFVARGAIFLGVWIVFGELLTRWAARELTVKARALAAVGLPAVGLTLTFAAFDWIMSLTPLWYSTIFGLLYFSGGFVAALSLVAVLARLARPEPRIVASIHASHTGALGRLMFAFLVFWAYMEFSQGIIIWIANKPDEVPWYIARGAGVWGGVFAVLIIGHFAIPFFALLSKPLKRRPTLLALAGAWIVAMHYVDVYWLVMPVLHRDFSLHWLDLAAPLAVLGVAIAIGVARTPRLLPDDNPALAAGVAYEGT